jgi:hypothetical protein
MRKISRLPTLKASQELKNWYFPTTLLPKHYLEVNYMFTKFQGQKIHQQKVIQNLPTLVDVENFSLLPTLTASQSLNYYFFVIKFLEQKPLNVNNIQYKFQCQNMNLKKDINNLPTCVVVGKNEGKPFHYYQL